MSDQFQTHIVTEAEARGRRCHKDLRDCCVGPRCMAWRWVRATIPTPNINMRGYCGLAGEPWDARADAASTPEKQT